MLALHPSVLADAGLVVVVIVKGLLHQVDGQVTLRLSLSPPAYSHKTHKHITLSVQVNALINIFYIYATMRKYLEKNIMPSTSIFQSIIFGAPTRLEPRTHRVVRRYWSSAPHADLRMIRSHIGHYNQWAA
jgi:hypothetical protein